MKKTEAKGRLQRDKNKRRKQRKTKKIRTKKERKGRGMYLCIENKKNHNSHHRSYLLLTQQHHNAIINASTTKATTRLAASSSFFFSFCFITPTPTISTVSLMNSGEPLFLDRTNINPNQNVWVGSGPVYLWVGFVGPTLVQPPFWTIISPNPVLGRYWPNSFGLTST